jgi:membrane dipeptidase
VGSERKAIEADEQLVRRSCKLIGGVPDVKPCDHRAVLIADAHTDLLLELAHRERLLGEMGVFARTWLPLLDTGGVALQVCPVYVDVRVQPEGSLRESLAQVTAFHHALAENTDRVVPVRTADDLDGIETDGRLRLLLSLEGVEQFGVETWPADLFHLLGVRMVGLTWNRRNAFADGAAEDTGGLSRLGRELIDRLVALGTILDVAHASRRLLDELLTRLDGHPVICSHGGCRAVHDTPRNLDDGQLRALAGAGGLFGLMLHPLAVDPVDRTVARAIDHLEHAAATIGVDRVCLGGDFTRRLWEVIPAPPEPKDGLMPAGLAPGSGLEGLTGPEHYQALVEALRGRGWREEDVVAACDWPARSSPRPFGPPRRDPARGRRTRAR